MADTLEATAPVSDAEKDVVRSLAKVLFMFEMKQNNPEMTQESLKDSRKQQWEAEKAIYVKKARLLAKRLDQAGLALSQKA